MFGRLAKYAAKKAERLDEELCKQIEKQYAFDKRLARIENSLAPETKERPCPHCGNGMITETLLSPVAQSAVAAILDSLGKKKGASGK